MKLAKILSIAFETDSNIDIKNMVQGNCQYMLTLLHQAAQMKTDFVVFPEIALQSGMTTVEAIENAESISGTTIDLACKCAKEINIYIVWPMTERDGGYVYNTAVLIGRNGNIIGKYRKFRPTSYEMVDGIQPGNDVPVFDTDFGRVGMAICFDIKFPEVGLALSRDKANLVFWPTMFEGGRRLEAWARDYGFAIVPCPGNVIVDSTGSIANMRDISVQLQQDKRLIQCAFAELNLDSKAYHLDNNQDKIPEMKNKYGANIEIKFCRPEGTFVLESNMPDKTVDDLEKEFELLALRDYLDAAVADGYLRLKGITKNETARP